MPSTTSPAIPTSPLLHPDSPAYRKARRQYYKSTKNRNAEIDHEWTPFRAAEKRYKARFPPPDLSGVLDLASLYPGRSHEIQQGIWTGRLDAVEFREIPLKDASLSGRKVVIIPSVPGLVILPSFLTHEKQRELARWALANHAHHPNETNLDIHYHVPHNGVWNQWLKAREVSTEDIVVEPKAIEADSANSSTPGPRQLVNNTPASPATYSDISSTPKPPQAPSPTVQPIPCSALLYKLRWANIGWFYHWGTKQYDFTKGKSVIDDVLRQVCRSAVAAVNWDIIYGGTDPQWGESGPEWKSWDATYEPDAGIVNFYQVKDALMGHVDRSEVCTTSPLVSVSLGNAAVFLIGGLTRDTEPVPILLRSGDVVIMSGPACRRAYHGVPRILEGTLPPHLQRASLKQDEQGAWQPYEDYLHTTRININVRQVFPKGFDPGIVM
ncbi:hypothetical protein BDQ17DRAFT_1240252 [Cyathus striatus]|nr:hypothetical protein BDQ17DRAFT_1240252 [Cyathus striatus]